MSTTKKIAQNTIVQIIGKIVSVTLGLLALGMMTRYLGTEQFGWYTTAISFLTFAGILIDFGLVPVTAQMMSEPAFDKEKLFQNLLSFRLLTALIFYGLVPFAILFFPYPQEIKIAVSFMTISFLGVAINQVLIGFLQTKLNMHIQVIGEVLGRIVLTIGIWLFIIGNAGFLPLMGVVTVSGLVYTIVLYLFIRKQTPIKLACDKAIWKAIVKKCWPIAIAIMFNVIYLKGDVVLLSLFKSQSEVGIYGAAYRVIDILAQMAMMMMGIMLPLLTYAWSRNDKKTFQQRFQQSFDMMMVLAMPLIVGGLVLAKPIMVLVAGSDFTASAPILQILILAILGVYLGAIFGHTAVAINKQKHVLWIYGTTALLTLIGYLIFIPIYGMYGAAWMTLFSELFTGFLLLGTVLWYVRMRLETKSFALITFSSFVMGGALYLMQNVHILLLIPIGALIYAVFIFGLGVVSRETVKEIFSTKV